MAPLARIVRRPGIAVKRASVSPAHQSLVFRDSLCHPNQRALHPHLERAGILTRMSAAQPLFKEEC